MSGHLGDYAPESRFNPTRTFASRGGIATLCMVLLGFVALIGAPIAQAATYTYANNISTPELQRRESGQRTAIAGGEAWTEPWGADGAGATVFITTYYPYPGYRTVATFSGGGEVRGTHPNSSNARQQCWWDFEYSNTSIGNLKMTCKTL